MDDALGPRAQPDDSRIRIERQGDETIVRIPRPTMPVVVYAAIALTSTSLLAVLIGGFMLFVLDKPFPGFDFLIGGPIRPMPTAWRVFGISGWLTLLIAGSITVAAAVGPLTRRETIRLSPRGLELRDTAIGGGRRMRFGIRDLGEFRRRKDPQGLIESELILLLNRPLLTGGEDEVVFARSTTESEKQWLASVLNGLLDRYRDPD